MKSEIAYKTGLASVAALAAGSSAVSAQDFTGLYAGLGAGLPTGDISTYVGDGPYTINGSTLSAFGGYNWSGANSDLIMGVELAYYTGFNYDLYGSADSPEDYNVRSVIDAKLKLGSALGNVMVYGFAGPSLMAHANDSGDDYTGVGFNLGVGAEILVTDSISVGFDHTARSMYSTQPDDSEVYGPSPVNTTSLRVAFRF